MQKVLLTGASGYIADQLLPTFKERYEMVLVDVVDTNRRGERVDGRRHSGPDRPRSRQVRQPVRGRRRNRPPRVQASNQGSNPLDHFFEEKENVEMAYNVFRSAYDAGASRVVMASSNHAADWYEHNLIHTRKMESLDPYRLPLSDNFYGWAKATYEHMGFLFACGAMDFRTAGGDQDHTGASQVQQRKLEVVMVRIGAPRELDPALYVENTGQLQARPRRVSQPPRSRSAVRQGFSEAPNIENEHGVPWQVVYGISNNTRAFWSLSNAREVLGYEPEDDSEVKYAEDIRRLLSGTDALGRVGE